MYRAVMPNRINSQTFGFSDIVQVTDSPQVMTCKTSPESPSLLTKNAYRVIEMQAALKSSYLNGDSIYLWF